MADPQEVGDVRHLTCTLCEAMCGLEVTLDPAGSIATMRGHEADPLSRPMLNRRLEHVIEYYRAALLPQ